MTAVYAESTRFTITGRSTLPRTGCPVFVRKRATPLVACKQIKRKKLPKSLDVDRLKSRKQRQPDSAARASPEITTSFGLLEVSFDTLCLYTCLSDIHPLLFVFSALSLSVSNYLEKVVSNE